MKKEDLEFMSEIVERSHWLFISELTALNLYEYGTSPRGGWLTPDGERFKKIILENEDAMSETEKYIMEKYN